MGALKKTGQMIYIHIYTRKASGIREILFFPKERYRLLLEPEEFQLTVPFWLYLQKEEELWNINGKKVQEEGILHLQTREEEPVWIVISSRRAGLYAMGRLLLKTGEEIRIGSTFLQELYYDRLNRETNIVIGRDDEKAVLKRNGKEGLTEPVYINGRAAGEEETLRTGDVIDIYGLRLVWLKEGLGGFAFYGVLRMAQRRHDPEREFAKDEPPPDRIVENYLPKRRDLPEGELEILLPEPIPRDREKPLLLTLAPSATMVLPMLLMAVIGSSYLGSGGANFYRLSVVMTGASSFLSVFWGIVNHRYARNIRQKEQREHKEEYQQYLEETEHYLLAVLDTYQKVLQQRYPESRLLLAGLPERPLIYWNRNPNQKDFYFIRLGMGNRPFPVHMKLSEQRKSIRAGRDEQKAAALLEAYQTAENVPVGIDLRTGGIVGFTGEHILPVFLQAVLQVLFTHAPEQLRVLFLFHEEKERERRIAEGLRFVPHIWDAGRKRRYLAGNSREADEVLSFLQKEYTLCGEQGREVDYLLLIAAPEYLKGSFGLWQGKREGVFCFYLTGKERELPGNCACLVTAGCGETLCRDAGSGIREPVQYEKAVPEQAGAYMRSLAAVGEGNTEEDSQIPGEISFLELFGVEEVEELNAAGRWKENTTENTMGVPIGMCAGQRLLYLDIHEKHHGPHGLIAGTTGAGKSELLQTYLLSLAVSYSPEEISFFIIDYKGGGMGNMLRGLPHCAGIISNLSGSQIQRALISIKSENRRRQRLFAGEGVNHISDYADLFREGAVQQAIPHLLLVVDEFAELKKEEPEFMQEIISVAQVGRSLGVHLLLATQKPAGTVDEKIWSNTRFRMALRVADKQDSMDMLHRPEAAGLTIAGRCYLQVGNNELFELFQTGYCGGKYGRKKKNAACLISPTGQRMRPKRKPEKGALTEMDAVTAYIQRTAEELEYKRPPSLWMQELEEKIMLSKLRYKQQGTDLKEISAEDREMIFLLGKADDPENQQQFPYIYKPFEDGHLVICGSPTAGKSTLLQTILYQMILQETEAVNFLLVAGENRGLACFEKAPGCMGILKREEAAECFFYHIKRMVKERKQLLDGISFRQHPKKPAAVFILIDNYGSFRQKTEDRYEDLLEQIAKEGPGNGIYLILTALNASGGELPGCLFEKIKTALTLEQSDRFQYGDILRNYRICVLPKPNVKGRGLCMAGGRVLEFQAAIAEGEDEWERIGSIERLCEEKSRKEALIPRFPQIPERLLYEHLQKERLWQRKPELLLLGLEEQSAYPVGITIEDDTTLLILGAAGSGKRTLLHILKRQLREMERPILFFEKGGDHERIKRIWEHGEKAEKRAVLCISDMNEFFREFPKDRKKPDDLPVIGICVTGREFEITGFTLFKQMIRNQVGIHLGGNAGSQRIIEFADLSYSRLNQWEKPGIGLFKAGGAAATKRVRLAEMGEKENDTGRYTDSDPE